MVRNHGQKSIKKVLNLAVVFQLIYLFSVCLINLLSKLNAIPESMIDIFQPHTEFIPVIDYLNILIVSISTISFILVHMFIRKKINKSCRVTAIHTIFIIIFAGVFHNVIPFFSGHWSFEYFAFLASSANRTFKMMVSNSTLVALEGWMAIWRFIAIILLLCSYSMYWFKSNISSAKTDITNPNTAEEGEIRH